MDVTQQKSEKWPLVTGEDVGPAALSALRVIVFLWIKSAALLQTADEKKIHSPG